MNDKNDTVIMPRTLIKNDRFADLFAGEFYQYYEQMCPDCCGGKYKELNTDHCGTCDDKGAIYEKHYISLLTIESIYIKVVKHFEVKQ